MRKMIEDSLWIALVVISVSLWLAAIWLMLHE
jgi:hypothetical protein